MRTDKDTLHIERQKKLLAELKQEPLEYRGVLKNWVTQLEDDVGIKRLNELKTQKSLPSQEEQQQFIDDLVQELKKTDYLSKNT